MLICNKIKVIVWFISVQKINLVLELNLLIPPESISPTFGMGTGVDQRSAILHWIVKAPITSTVAHHPSFTPARQEKSLPKSGLGRNCESVA